MEANERNEQEDRQEEMEANERNEQEDRQEEMEANEMNMEWAIYWPLPSYEAPSCWQIHLNSSGMERSSVVPLKTYRCEHFT